MRSGDSVVLGMVEALALEHNLFHPSGSGSINTLASPQASSFRNYLLTHRCPEPEPVVFLPSIFIKAENPSQKSPTKFPLDIIKLHQVTCPLLKPVICERNGFLLRLIRVYQRPQGRDGPGSVCHKCTQRKQNKGRQNS